jgi:hypothetical protein
LETPYDNDHLHRKPHRPANRRPLQRPYNDFMSVGGKFYEATKETAEAVGFYDNMRKLIPAIRAVRIQAIIVPHHRWREGDHKGWIRHPRRHYQEDKQ